MAMIGFRLNGEPTELDIDPDRLLLWVLRTDLELTGTKYGCGAGLCGSCAVIVDDEPVRSCRTRMKDIEGTEVMTIEGLASDGSLHPLQEEFAERGALQCGYCTPGMIMSAYGLLLDNPSPSRGEIIEGMNRNLCRCAAHKRIVEAIEAAAGRVASR
jgi:aerobic-type carbon monoxide dehydrogenase small subunit (CoxS/CutS family)